MPKFIYGVSPTSNVIRVKLMNSTKNDGSGITGLKNNSSGLIVSTMKITESAATTYSTSASTIDTITTLGTYSAPSAVGRCRFAEFNGSTNPGVYELQLRDERFSATDSLIISVFGNSALAQCDIEIECRNLASNLTQISGTAISTPATAGILDVNIKNMNNVAATSISAINANQGTTQPINFTGTATNALVKSDMQDILGSAVSTSSAQIGVNMISAANNSISDSSFSATTTTKCILTAIATSGAASSITLNAGASSTDDFYSYTMVKIVAGTGVGQSRMIVYYVGSSKVAYINKVWKTNPDATSVFVIDNFSAPPLILTAGLVSAAGASTVTILPKESTVDNRYTGDVIRIVGGTGLGQVRYISSYVGATRIVTVHKAWDTQPDGSSLYEIQALENEVNEYAINGDTTAPGALANQFNGTGLLGNTYPARQDQLTTIVSTTGYLDGAIWVDTVSGTSGTTLFVNGVADKPTNSWANALTLAAALNTKRFHINSGSTITLTGNSDNYTMVGDAGWTINLNGQSINNAWIHGADVSGVGVATTAEPVFDTCDFVGNCTLPVGEYRYCGFDTFTFTLVSGAYVFTDCYYEDPIQVNWPIFIFTSATAIEANDWRGAIQVKSMTSASNYLTVGGVGRLNIDSSCTAGVITVRGFFAYPTGGAAFITAGGTLTTTTRFASDQSVQSVTNRVTANSDQIAGVSAAANQLSISAPTMISGTVTSAGLIPSTTIFQTSLTTSAANFYTERTIIFTSGVLQNQARSITAYSLVGGRGQFTIDTLSSAPSNGDSFIIV